MSYLTHFKFSTMVIPDILPLFRARFRIFWWILYFEFFFVRDLKLFFPSFAQGFGFFINWFFVPLSVRGLEFFWKTILLSSFARGSKLISDTSILFRPRFWIFLKLIHRLSVRARFRVLLKNDTSILFCPRFESDLGLPILLSYSVRGSKLIFIYWYFYPLPSKVLDFSQIDALPLCPREI